MLQQRAPIFLTEKMPFIVCMGLKKTVSRNFTSINKLGFTKQSELR